MPFFERLTLTPRTCEAHGYKFRNYEPEGNSVKLTCSEACCTNRFQGSMTDLDIDQFYCRSPASL
jgi:hypothetical protein